MAEPAGRTGPGCGIGGVLGEFDDETIPVTPEGEVFLGVGVLPEPDRGVRPRGEYPVANRCGAERVGSR
ncbi:MAG: hypothetical protein P8Z68_11340 [Kineosporiaceae bacterium]